VRLPEGGAVAGVALAAAPRAGTTLQDRAAGGHAVHGLLDEERCAILGLFDECAVAYGRARRMRWPGTPGHS
jgi:hypothetical protein